jgi:hypothetical protein
MNLQQRKFVKLSPRGVARRGKSCSCDISLVNRLYHLKAVIRTVKLSVAKQDIFALLAVITE